MKRKKAYLLLAVTVIMAGWLLSRKIIREKSLTALKDSLFLELEMPEYFEAKPEILNTRTLVKASNGKELSVSSSSLDLSKPGLYWVRYAVTSVDRYGQIAEMGISVNKSGKDRGFIGDYRFRKSTFPDGSVIVIFYDCGRSLENARSFLMISIGISLICLLLVYILIAVLSKVAIRPAAEAYEKQKQFITDAGHELKTPLAIINADADVLEMDLPETEDRWRTPLVFAFR